MITPSSLLWDDRSAVPGVPKYIAEQASSAAFVSGRPAPAKMHPRPAFNCTVLPSRDDQNSSAPGPPEAS